MEPVEQRCAELMDPGERQLHLGFHAPYLGHTESRCMTRHVPEQRRLADAGLASDDQNPALTLSRAGEPSVECCALTCPVEEPCRRGGSHLEAKLTNPATLRAIRHNPGIRSHDHRPR